MNEERGNMFTTSQIAELTRQRIHAPLDQVTEAELSAAITDYIAFTHDSQWPQFRTPIPPERMAHSLLGIISQTRDGIQCLACKMGMCAN